MMLVPTSRASLRRWAFAGISATGFGRIDRALVHSPHVRVFNAHGTPQATAAGFRRSVEYIKSRYHLAMPDEVFAMLRGDVPIRRNVAMFTFDDGLASNADVVAPLLETFGTRGVFLLPTAFLLAPPAEHAAFFWRRVQLRHEIPRCDDELHRGMSVEQARSLAQRGHVIGAHTMTHENLATVPPERLIEEVVTSGDVLADAIGKPVDSFAWTFAWNAISSDAWRLARKRYAHIFSACPGVHSAPSPHCIFRTNFEASARVSEAATVSTRLWDLRYHRERAWLLDLLHKSEP